MTTRTAIQRYVQSHPGVHSDELVRELDLATGQVQHLLRFRGDGNVVADALCGRTRYHPPEYGEWKRRVLAPIRRETSRNVVLYALERGPTRPQRVADELGVARSALKWHLAHPVDRDRVDSLLSE